jgi:hypothetical protein
MSTWQGLYTAVSEGGLRLVRIPGPRSAANPPDFPGSNELSIFIPPASRLEEEVRVSPTAMGAAHPIMRITAPGETEETSWKQLGSNAGFYAFQDILPGSQILAEARRGLRGGPREAIALRPLGQGLVLALALDDTWRWRVGNSPAGAARPWPHHFWRRVIRWLVTGEVTDPAAGLHLFTERDRFYRGEPVRLLATLVLPAAESKAGIRVEAQHRTPEGIEESLEMLRDTERTLGEAMNYSAELLPNHPGVHWVRATASRDGEVIGTDEVTFDVEESGLERIRTSLNRALLMRLAESTHGLYGDDPEIEPALQALRRHRRETVMTRTVTQRLWDNPILYILFVAALGTEWVIRKHRDLA